MLIYVDICSSSTRSNKKIWPSPSPPDSPSDVVSFTVMYSSHSEPSSHRSSSQSHSCQASWTWQQIIDVGNPPVKLWKKNSDGSPGDPRFFFNKKSLVFMDVLGIWMFLIDHPSLTWHLTPNSAPWARHSSKKECLCDSLSKSLWKTSSPHGHGPCHATDVGHVRFSTGPWTWWKSSWQNGSSRLFDFEMTWSSDLKASQLTCRTDTAAGGP